MSQLRIERGPIKAYYLGKFRLDHLNLSLQQDDLIQEQDGWYVMEGAFVDGPGGPFVGVVGEDGTTTLSEANNDLTGVALLDSIGAPYDRSSLVIDTPTGATNTWSVMQAYAAEIDAESLPYIALGYPGSADPTINSSSVVASLLFYAGIDIQDYFPRAFLRFTAGTHTLIGESIAETMRTNDNFDTLVAGEGNDELFGRTVNSGVEKFYGGGDNDTIKWSPGLNIIHGGQPRMAYDADGIDTLNYDGVQFVYIKFNPYSIPHEVAQFVATHDSGTEFLFSIEQLSWNAKSDIVIFDQNVGHADRLPYIKLGQEDSSGKGDEITFANNSSGLLINASTTDGYLLAIDETSPNPDAGMWIESAEWLTGSKGNDKIYAGTTLRGVEGGDGNDLIDGRDAVQFSYKSPNGFDIELFGGKGDDTIVSGQGYSDATGGDGSDMFVVSTLSWEGTTVEFVINDAESNDRLFLPYNFFNGSLGDFDGSLLMPVLGAVTEPGKASFAALPQNEGSFKDNPSGRSDFVKFIFEMQSDYWDNADGTKGIIDFAGSLLFNRDGDDLLIHAFEGSGFEIAEDGFGDEPWVHIVNSFRPSSETIIRVKNFEEGDLGINFYDLGKHTSAYLQTSHGNYAPKDYPNWDKAALALTNGGSLTSALDLRPDGTAFEDPPPPETAQKQKGNDFDNIIVVTAPLADVDGAGGNDTLTTGDGNDTLNGGSGNDSMTGGRGNDTYFADSSGDVIIELAQQGFDTINATVDFTLSDHVEYLELSGGAITGSGNDLDNRITGTDANNYLNGGDGSDTLVGGLGDDRLNGGNGNDVFFYRRGDGNDLVIDTSGINDVLYLHNLTAADLSFFIRAATLSDITIAVDGGGHVTLQNIFASADSSIERIVFDDFSEISRSKIVSLAQASAPSHNEAPQAGRDTGYGMYSGTLTIAVSELLANDFDFDGGALKVTSVNAASAGITASLDGRGNIVVTTPDGYTGTADIRYTISDANGATDTETVEIDVLANSAPIAIATLSNQIVSAGAEFLYQIPAGLFQDADLDRIEISATLAGGGALPSWLAFNPVSGTLSGTAPLGSIGTIRIAVTGSDGFAAATATFDLKFNDPSAPSVILGTNGTDTLTGTNSGDIINGLRGNDVLQGRGGDDIFLITGFNGADLFIGGSGFDTILGSDGRDVIGLADGAANLNGIEAIDGGAGYDSIRLGTGSRSNSEFDFTGVQLISIELIDGGVGDDIIRGSRSGDVISGGRGDDDLKGGRGDDVFLVSGHAGSDSYAGGSGKDTIQGSTGDDVISLKTSLKSIEVIRAGSGYDVLTLTSGGDTLDLSDVSVYGLELIDAGAGNDRLTGSPDDDKLRGGAGNDLFVFKANFGADTIDDFETGSSFNPIADMIDLRDFELTSFAQVLSLAHTDGKDTVIAIDGHGSIRLKNVTEAQLHADDFILA